MLHMRKILTTGITSHCRYCQLYHCTITVLDLCITCICASRVNKVLCTSVVAELPRNRKCKVDREEEKKRFKTCKWCTGTKQKWYKKPYLKLFPAFDTSTCKSTCLKLMDQKAYWSLSFLEKEKKEKKRRSSPRPWSSKRTTVMINGRKHLHLTPLVPS